ncbi:MAG: TolC family protein [Deltaproteobacteria bacterium]|nr:TolC family protein [Deltaproteobacteria bacterium]
MKRAWKNILVIDLCLFWLLASVAFCGQKEGGERILGLRECVDLAIKNDPDIIDTKGQIHIGELTAKEAKKDLILPTLNLGMTYGPKLDFFGRPIATDSIYLSTASVEKPLYRGGELINAYRLGRKMTERAKFDLFRRQAGITETTAKAYYDLLSAQENVRYNEELDEQAKQTVALLKEKFAMGVALRVDVLEAEGRRNNIRYRLISARNDLVEAKGKMNVLMGRDPESDILVREEFPVPPLKADVKTLTATALEQRPDLLYQKEDAAFNQLKIALGESSRYPHLSLVGSYSWEGDQFPGEEKEWAVGVKLTFSLFDSTLSSSVARNRLLENRFNFVGTAANYDSKSVNLSLFDGSSKKIDVEKARAAYRLAKNRLAQAKRNAAADVQEAINRLSEAEALLETTRSMVAYSKEKLKLLEKRLQLRETTELDVLDARTRLADAQVRYLKSLYAKAVDVVSLYRATGKRLQWKETPK